MDPDPRKSWLRIGTEVDRNGTTPSSNDIYVPTKNSKNLLQVISTTILINYDTMVQMFLQINKETSGIKYHRAVNRQNRINPTTEIYLS